MALPSLLSLPNHQHHAQVSTPGPWHLHSHPPPTPFGMLRRHARPRAAWGYPDKLREVIPHKNNCSSPG